jgi:hypothetical protein
MSPEFREVPSVWTLAGGALLLATLALHEIALWHLRNSKDAQRKRKFSADAAGEAMELTPTADGSAKVPSEPPRRFRPLRWRALHGVAVPAAEDGPGNDDRGAPDARDTPRSPSSRAVGV